MGLHSPKSPSETQTFFDQLLATPAYSQLVNLAGASPTMYQISSNLRAPYTMQSAASIERQVTKNATVSVTYLNSRGEHAFYIDNVNAPFFRAANSERDQREYLPVRLGWDLSSEPADCECTG